SSEIFKRAFQYDKEILEIGYPRNDYLVNFNTNENISKIKIKLGIPLDKKIVLYAPTWRDDQYYKVGHYKFSLHLDINKMKKELGKNYVILLRTHYLISGNIDSSEFGDF